jgi:hypothetical protein
MQGYVVFSKTFTLESFVQGIFEKRGRIRSYENFLTLTFNPRANQITQVTLYTTPLVIITSSARFLNETVARAETVYVKIAEIFSDFIVIFYKFAILAQLSYSPTFIFI